jgi:hypothetical protein
MRRIVLAAALLVLPLSCYAAPNVAPNVPAPNVPGPWTGANPSLTLVQGWWEHEHREDRARQGYWRLPPDGLEHYNRLQAEINELQAQRREIDERLARALAEQHRMLGFGER